MHQILSYFTLHKLAAMYMQKLANTTNVVATITYGYKPDEIY